MTTWMWFIIGWIAFDTILKVVCLGVDYLPPRSKAGSILDIILNVGAMMWGIALLAKEAS